MEISIEKDKKFQEQLDKQHKQTEAEMIVHNADIRNKVERIEHGTLFGTVGYWSGVGLPVAAAMFFLFFARTKKRNEEEVRVKAEQKNRKGELESALNELVTMSPTDTSAFFSKIEQNLQLLMSSLNHDQEIKHYSKSEIVERIRQEGGNAERINEVLQISENLRYGFGGGESMDAEAIRKDTIDVIRSIIR